MTFRRIAAALLLVGLAVAALTPWTVQSERAVSALARQIKQGYGIALASNGRLTFTLLPMPSLDLSGVRVASADGLVDAEVDHLRGQLRLLPLVRGQIRLAKLSLTGASISVTLKDDPAVATLLDDLRGRLVGDDARWSPRIDRLVLTNADIGVRNADGAELARFVRTSLVLDSPDTDGDLDLTASGVWNGQPTQLSIDGLNVIAIRDGRPQDVKLGLASALLTASFEGKLIWAAGQQLAGTLHAETPSLSRLAQWTGLLSDLRNADRSGTLSAEATVTPAKLQLPRLTLDIGRDRLEGALGVEFGQRPHVRATLAGNEVDVGWLRKLADPPANERLWADYDLRLSSTVLSWGPAKLRDTALSIQATPRSAEISLGRASFAGGSVRARIVAALDGEGRELRIQGWGDGVDLERALGEIAGVKGMSGKASGQFALEMSGERGTATSRQLRGRGTVTAKDGEFSGSALAEEPKRRAGSSEWRSGRIRFSEASAAIEIEDGSAKLSTASVATPDGRASVSGRINLETMAASLRVSVPPTGPGSSGAARPASQLDLRGPIQRMSVTSAADP